ncbi:unnamed protein product [Effrenium voratum]|uniref:EF-hand domain-containing protein n=1 Tax=Effrenium voratum TaxID=2562239 RepID=A0AA36I1B0_9DINO|nr:unnamed protein product [Effrenium voratum]CAJ1444477.1 unnamed protein product [Effrenium voratum]
MSAAQIQELFKKFDKDGNGRISVSELQNVLMWINKDITVAEIGKILREVDTNNDGAIDYNEFVAWTQGGKKCLSKKKPSLVPDLQRALEKSQEEAKAAAAIPFDAVMTITYMGEIKQFDKSGGMLESMGVRTPANQRYTSVEEDIKHLEKVKDPHKLNLNCFAVDWGSRNIVTGSADHSLKMWNFYGNVLRTYSGHASEVLSVDVDWKNHRMLSGSLGSDLKIWRLDNSAPLRGWRGSSSGGIACMNVSWRMFKAVFGCGNNLEVRDVSLRPEEAEVDPPLVLTGHRAPVTAVVTDWGEGWAMSGSLDKSLRRWDIKAGTALQTFLAPAPIRCLSLASPGCLLTGDECGNIQIWDTLGTVQQVLTAHKEGVICLSQVHEGHFVSGGRDGKVMYWRLPDGACLRTLEVAEITAGVWVVGVAALPEKQTDDQRKVLANARHGTFVEAP